MLARSSKLIHPLGAQIETPLLISSFSSKGFRFLRQKKDFLKSEVEELILVTSELIHDTALISAFDLKYYLGSADKLLRKLNLLPELLFIDSGGYETIEDYDLSEVYRYPIRTREWNVKFHEEELKKFPKIPLVVISYDNGQERRISLKNQIERAKKLFAKFPDQLNDFLIKPSKREASYLNFDEVLENISLMKKFNIIGVTEKELGSSISQRMQNIKTLRTSLDSVNCTSPIHIFGNLDPLTSVLYFVSGAEIFDGLSWLRYGFHQGLSINKSNIDMLEGRVNELDYVNSNMAMFQNLIYMRRLTQEMKTFVKKYKEGKEDEAFNSLQFIGSKVKDILNSSK